MDKSNKAIKLNLSKFAQNEFTRMADSILAYIKSITPKSQELFTFGIHSYEHGADTFKKYSEDGVVKSEVLENFTWEELEKNISGLSNFIDKYGLGKSFTLATGADVPPHRHYYTLDSMWSISMFRGDTPGTIKFFQNKNSIGAGDQSNVSLNYDDWIVSEQIKSYPGDFYSLKTWNWHGWLSDNSNLYSYCTIFYMNNTTSFDSALAAVKHIEQY